MLFQSSHPSKYWGGLLQLNFEEQIRTSALSIT